MKKTIITFSYDDEKLSALRLYLQQKEQTLENELISASDSLYIKTVPSNVREFIDLHTGLLKTTEKKKKSKSSIPTEPVNERGSEN